MEGKRGGGKEGKRIFVRPKNIFEIIHILINKNDLLMINEYLVENI